MREDHGYRRQSAQAVQICNFFRAFHRTPCCLRGSAANDTGVGVERHAGRRAGAQSGAGKPLTDAVLRIPVEPEPPLYSVELAFEILPELPDAHVAVLEVIDHLYARAGTVLPKEAVETVTLEDFEQILEVVADEVHVVELVVVEHGAAAFFRLRQPFAFVNAVGGDEVAGCI